MQRYLCNGQVHLHSPYEPDMTFVLIHRVVEAWDDMDAEDIYLNHLAESDIADHIRFIETKITPLAYNAGPSIGRGLFCAFGEFAAPLTAT